jgi:hypothetical protein
MRMLISFVFLLSLAGLTGFLAKRRGRDPVGWFLISLIVGAFGLLALFIMSDKSKEQTTDLEEDEDKLLTGNDSFTETTVYAKKWFYLDEDHQQSGPHSFEIIQELWDSSTLHVETYVWSEGMLGWSRVREVSSLQEALQGKELNLAGSAR